MRHWEKKKFWGIFFFLFFRTQLSVTDGMENQLSCASPIYFYIFFFRFFKRWRCHHCRLSLSRNSPEPKAKRENSITHTTNRQTQSTAYPLFSFPSSFIHFGSWFLLCRQAQNGILEKWMKLLTSCCCCCVLFSIWLHHLFLWLNSKSFEHCCTSVRLWLVSCLLERVMRCVACWWPCLCHRTWLNENCCCCCCTSRLWIVSLFHHHTSQPRIRSEVVPPHWILLRLLLPLFI